MCTCKRQSSRLSDFNCACHLVSSNLSGCRSILSERHFRKPPIHRADCLMNSGHFESCPAQARLAPLRRLLSCSVTRQFQSPVAVTQSLTHASSTAKLQLQLARTRTCRASNLAAAPTEQPEPHIGARCSSCARRPHN